MNYDHTLSVREYVRSYDLMIRTALGRKVLIATQTHLTELQKLAFSTETRTKDLLKVPAMQRLEKRYQKERTRLQARVDALNASIDKAYKAICDAEQVAPSRFHHHHIRLDYWTNQPNLESWLHERRSTDGKQTRYQQVLDSVETMAKTLGTTIDDWWLLQEAESDKKVRLQSMRTLLSGPLPALFTQQLTELKKLLGAKA